MKHPFVPLDFTRFPEPEMIRRSEGFYKELDRRRSVREYDPRPVPREVLEHAILTAGTAPSGAHKQPWHFVLVGSAETKAKIRENAEAEEKESYQRRMPQSWLDDLEPLGTDWHKPFLTVCPWLIVIMAKSYDLDPGEKSKRKNYYVQESVGIATGMLLAALHHAGVATLTHTPSPMGFLAKILNRPENERAYMLIATGYPAANCQVPDLRRKPVGEIMTEM